MPSTKAIFFVSLAILLGGNTFSQDATKLWMGLNAQARITREWRVSVGQLYMFNRGPLDLTTVQSSVNVTYRCNRRWRLGLGYQQSYDPFDLSTEERNRLTARASYAGSLQNIRVLHFFRTEWHFPERSKFEYRLRYAFRIHRRNWDLPLRARPFMTNEFHYYISGRPLWYRDNAGERVVRQSPDGLHAHRITLGVRISPMKRTNVTLRFMRQTEFNLGNKYRRINVEDPRNGKVRRKFNNFSALVISTSYRFSM